MRISTKSTASSTAWTREYDKRDVMAMLTEAGVLASAIMDTDDLSKEESLLRSGTFLTMQHPVRGEVVIPGWPLKMSDTSVPVAPSPLLGANNQDVYQDLLGMGAAELAALKKEGTI